jgi:hypothetical protein
MGAEIKKWQNPFPNIMFFYFIFCCCVKYHAANFLIGGCDSFENGRGFWRMWLGMLVRTWQHCPNSAPPPPCRVSADLSTRHPRHSAPVSLINYTCIYAPTYNV